MSKRYVDPIDYSPTIIKALDKGILLTTKADDTVNSMIIGWGTIGREWNTPVFTAYVRHSRYTHDLLAANPEFTVNIPLDGYDKEIIKVCGSKSGRDLDKIAELGLTLEEPETISVPGIKELPLTLECKVIHTEEQLVENLDPRYADAFYKKGTALENDIHTVYYGEILAAYIIE